MTEAEQQDGDWTSLFVLGTTLLRSRWRIVRWMLLGGALAALVASFRPVLYSASASFVPQGNDAGVSGLASLAGQFGVSLSTGNQSQSPDFYRSLLNSHVLLRPIARDTFVVQELGGQQIAFLDLFEIQEELATRRLDKGVVHLGSILRTSVDNSTGIVRLSVATEWPSVSLAIATALVEGVHAFNQRMRQGEAAAERKFVEARLSVVEAELREAEDRLERFLMTNRSFEGSPELTFQRDRLQRDVLSRQQVLTSLTQSYEEARIREVRNTPVITLIEAPSLPALPEPRRRLLLGLVGVMLGGGAGIILVLGSATLRHHRGVGDPGAEGLVTALDEAKRDVRNPVRAVRGLVGR